VSQRNNLLKIKKLSVIGMILAALSFLGFFLVYEEADRGLIRLDQQRFGTPFQDEE